MEVPSLCAASINACPYCRSQTEEYTKLIRAQDAEGIMALLTDKAVEKKVNAETPCQWELLVFSGNCLYASFYHT